MSVESLRQQAESLDSKGAMTELGLLEEPALQQLAEVLESHELGTTPRALMIYVRDWLKRIEGANTFADVSNDEERLAELRVALPASNSVSRAIPLGMVMKEHLEKVSMTAKGIDPEKAVLIDLAGSRGYVSQILLKPELFAMRFFEKFRTRVVPSQVMRVSQAVVVDRRIPTPEEATQPFAGYADKMRVFEELEAHEDFEGRLTRLVSDIRELSSEQLQEHLPEGAQPILMLNNVLYQVSEEVRAQIQERVDQLMVELKAPLVTMETWQAHFPDKPHVETPTGRVFPAPAVVTLREDVDRVPRPVAYLDGTTGKPFVMTSRSGYQVYVDKKGWTHVMS